MFIFWILVIVAVIYIAKKHDVFDSVGTHKSSALDVLNKRYVNGEIDEETYLRMKKEIS